MSLDRNSVVGASVVRLIPISFQVLHRVLIFKNKNQACFVSFSSISVAISSIHCYISFRKILLFGTSTNLASERSRSLDFVTLPTSPRSYHSSFVARQRPPPISTELKIEVDTHLLLNVGLGSRVSGTGLRFVSPFIFCTP